MKEERYVNTCITLYLISNTIFSYTFIWQKSERLTLYNFTYNIIVKGIVSTGYYSDVLYARIVSWWFSRLARPAPGCIAASYHSLCMPRLAIFEGRCYAPINVLPHYPPPGLTRRIYRGFDCYNCPQWWGIWHTCKLVHKKKLWCISFFIKDRHSL